MSLETRTPNARGSARHARDLVRTPCMRPDRIILGEVRGGEALDMLQAMNTGHEGSMTTIHANDTRDALSRLEVMVSMAGFDLPVSVVRRYIGSAITLVVHLARLKGGVRRVMRVSEITGLDSGDYQMQEIFGFRQSGVDEEGRAKGVFYATGNVPAFVRRFEVGIELPHGLFEKRTFGVAKLNGTNGSAPGGRFVNPTVLALLAFVTASAVALAQALLVRDLRRPMKRSTAAWASRATRSAVSLPSAREHRADRSVFLPVARPVGHAARLADGPGHRGRSWRSSAARAAGLWTASSWRSSEPARRAALLWWEIGRMRAYRAMQRDCPKRSN